MAERRVTSLPLATADLGCLAQPRARADTRPGLERPPILSVPSLERPHVLQIEGRA